MFNEYDRYLSNEWNIDYWYDIGVVRAADLLDKFGEKDWEQLLRDLPTKQEEWKCRCAETLGDVECSSVFLVLEKLIETSSRDQLMAVVDAIRAQAHGGRKMRMTASLQATLASLRKDASKIDNLVLNDLNSVLSNSGS
jgi:hypothetical protein